MKMFLTVWAAMPSLWLPEILDRSTCPAIISGLKETLLILKETQGIGIITLDEKDVIRHSLVKKVIDAYKRIEHHN